MPFTDSLWLTPILHNYEKKLNRRSLKVWKSAHCFVPEWAICSDKSFFPRSLNGLKYVWETVRRTYVQNLCSRLPWFGMDFLNEADPQKDFCGRKIKNSFNICWFKNVSSWCFLSCKCLNECQVFSKTENEHQ